MSSFNCCYKCEERSLGCHSTCGIYIQEKKQNEENKLAYRKSLNPIIGKGAFLGDEGQMKQYPKERYKRTKHRK